MRMLRHLRQIPAACTLSAGILVSVQAQQALRLDQLLSQIVVNTERYSATVSSFICNEHILSQKVHEGKIKRETTVDAVFSVTRSTAKADTLEESREIKLIDGRPAAGKTMIMPLSPAGTRMSKRRRSSVQCNRCSQSPRLLAISDPLILPHYRSPLSKRVADSYAACSRLASRTWRSCSPTVCFGT
jgi:hypothetical protein